MFPTLLRRLGLLPRLVLLLLALGGARPALATHLLGGEMTYRYLDANGPADARLRYEITVTIYNNTNTGAAAPNTDAPVGIYDLDTGTKINLVQGVNVLAGSGATVPSTGSLAGIMDITAYTISPNLNPGTLAGCPAAGVTQTFRLQKFVAIVNLPANAGGYYALFTRSARNVDVKNLNTAGNNQSLILYSALSRPLLPNRSPVFSDTAVAVVCQGDTTIVLNNAADPDGDRLVYAFGQPYGNNGNNGVPPGVFPLSYATTPPTPSLPTVPYYGGAGYSASTPFGTAAGNYASLNASTGTAKYRAAAGTAGAKYVVAVDVSEYRTINGREVLIGTTRRDLQLLVGDCPATATPVLPLATTTPRSYTIEEGSSLSIPLTVTQANGHALTLTLNSVLLDGAGGFNTTFNGSAGTVVPGNVTGTATASGTGGRVSGTFVYNSACGEARATPYDVAFTARDLACGGKLVADVLRITVTRPSGPTAISGDAVVCNLNTVSTYQASGGTAPSVRWRVVGGTIVGSNTGRSVQVRWATAGAGTLVAKGISTYGCLTDSVSQAVTVAPAGALTITGGGSVCLGTSATLAVAGGGAPYTLTDGNGNTQTGPGPFIVTPTATTTYTITSGVAVLGCTASQQATVTVLPLPVAAVGLPTRATCTGVPISLGAAPVVGFTYSWSPATGLSSATVANPTLTLTNPTGAPVTTTYTLTVTNTATGCVGTGTVAVTVNPGATAAAGPAQAVCAGSTITLGTAALPGYTYQWTPATGLNSSTAAQPVLTAVNPTSAPIIQKYVVLATTSLGCSSKDSVLITINPRPAADTITGPTSVCPTVTGIVYAIKNPRSPAYQWAVTSGTLVSGQGSASITVNWGAAGAGSVSAIATSALGCAADAFVLPVRINQQLQTAKPTGPTSVCQADGPYTYQTPLANGSSYSWQLFGTAQGTLTNTSNTTSIRFTTAGLAKLVVTETSNPAGGICRGVSDTLYITVKPSPLASLSIQGPARFCVNSGPQTYTLAGFSGSTYVFQLNGTTIANTNGTVVIPASTAVGTYTLTARETSAGGCVGPLYTRTFTVDPLPAAVTISGPRFVCPATRTLTYTVANAPASSTFQWTVTGATITAGQGTATITVSFPAAPSSTNATVSVVETSQYGCGGPLASLTVVPDNANAPLFTLASVVATDNTKVTLTFSVASPGTTPNPVRVLRREAGSSGAYAQVGMVAATATTFVDATANAATTSYQYTLALTNGCGDVLPGVGSHTTVLLKAVAVPGPGGRNQGSTRLSWTAYQGFAVAGYRVYQQADNGGYQLLSTVSGSTLQADVPNTVQASSGTGFNLCYRVVAFEGAVTPGTPLHESNSNTSCVDFANKTAFYNVITPNGDGQNDVLIIDNVQLYPGSSLAIFNRWGREVYRTTSYNNTTVAWGADPTIAAGVYYYLFKLADGTSTKGWVEVVK